MKTDIFLHFISSFLLNLPFGFLSSSVSDSLTFYTLSLSYPQGYGGKCFQSDVSGPRHSPSQVPCFSPRPSAYCWEGSTSVLQCTALPVPSFSRNQHATELPYSSILPFLREPWPPSLSELFLFMNIS